MAGDGLIHWDDAMGRDVAAGPMAGRWDDLGTQRRQRDDWSAPRPVAPGMRSTPVHVHDDEEEIYVVLGGEGLLWQDGATCEVRSGDVIAEVGRARALTPSSPDAEGLEVLMFGERNQSPDGTPAPRRGGVARRPLDRRRRRSASVGAGGGGGRACRRRRPARGSPT